MAAFAGVLIGLAVVFGGGALFTLWCIHCEPPKPPYEKKEGEEELPPGIGAQYPFYVPRGIGRGRG